MIINGKKILSTKTFNIVNPFTQKVVGSASNASAKQIRDAMELSYRTKTTLSGKQRSVFLKGMVEILRNKKQELAMLITDESGLSLKDTLYEVDRVIDVVFFSSLVARDIDCDTTDNYILGDQKNRPNLKVITEPLDLIVGITPFNHPLNQVAHKVFPAIAAGAPMVLKPSEKTPLSAIRLGELLLEAGLEKNMINIITGVPPAKIVDQMSSSPIIDMVTFTGGYEVGLRIKKKMVDAGNALKRFVPELGGCSALIIHRDADLVKSVGVAISGCFANSGQRCTAIRRVIVDNFIADRFVEMVTQAAKNIKYGNPYDSETDMGTVISVKAAKIIEQRVNHAISDGAKLTLGNIRKGTLYSPTVLDKVSVNSILVSKETFGPVCPVIRAKNINEAIKLANQTDYRLAGAVMTQSREIAEKVSDALVVGQFNWNGTPSYRTELAPFGGFKASGNGEKEGVLLAAQGMRRIRTFYAH